MSFSERPKINVAAVQLNCTDSIDANVERAIDQIRTAAADGAQLVCLQEMFTSLYFCQTEDHEQFRWAETIPGPTTDKLWRRRQGRKSRAGGGDVRTPRRRAVS